MAPVARGAVLLLVALSLATSASAVINPFWGGAQPLEPVAKALIAQWNAAAKTKPALLVGPYDPSGSSNGIKGFYNGTYLIGAASEPITATVEGQNPGVSKITLPVAVAAYNFFVHGPSIVLTAADSYNIYSGSVTDWGSIPAAKGKITGAISRYARSDKVGTTAIIQQLWVKAGTGYSGKTDGSPLTFSGLLTVASNAAMCNAVVAKAGSIGYAHVSACAVQVKKFKNKISEALLKNALGQALSSKTWVATNALTGAPPAPDASWDQVDLIWKSIAKAPAAVSMQYVFVKKTLPKNGGAVAKQFLVSSLAKFKGQAVANGFNFVPPAWFNPSANAVKTVAVSTS
ncbi:unnamed protein product [Closterium sp. Yama58-4]|nr:unnamed protein product [Closterium sp. Yama58-4]CAI5468625.1 unnamed protein product [Closterium sp. Yama58-4]